MESIDALRKYVNGTTISTWTRNYIDQHIDAIEREVKELREREYRNGREDAEGAVEFADRLKAAVDGREDVTLWGVDYMPYPLDADAVPIHVGDVMENIVCPSVHREVMGVGVECFYGWDMGNGRYSQFGANCYRHHRAPTVEDVLREFADEVRRCCDTADTIAEYAAKLRELGIEVDG